MKRWENNIDKYLYTVYALYIAYGEYELRNTRDLMRGGKSWLWVMTAAGFNREPRGKKWMQA
jgi:hypothetical protein